MNHLIVHKKNIYLSTVSVPICLNMYVYIFFLNQYQFPHTFKSDEVKHLWLSFTINGSQL